MDNSVDLSGVIADYFFVFVDMVRSHITEKGFDALKHQINISID